MNSTKKNARIAGFLYLLQAFIAPINLMYIPSALIVSGNATATANNIRSSEFLFRIGIAGELTAQVLAPFIVWALYRLLKDIDPLQALLMVILAVIGTATTFLNSLNQIAALVILKGAGFLSVFAKSQLDALAYLFLRLQSNGVMAASIFWGLWLFPFGLLVYRSRFIPRIFGVLLIINGVAYLVASYCHFLLPQYPAIPQFMLIPELGEPEIILWLVIKGARDLDVVPS